MALLVVAFDHFLGKILQSDLTLFKAAQLSPAQGKLLKKSIFKKTTPSSQMKKNVNL